MSYPFPDRSDSLGIPSTGTPHSGISRDVNSGLRQKQAGFAVYALTLVLTSWPQLDEQHSSNVDTLVDAD